MKDRGASFGLDMSFLKATEPSQEDAFASTHRGVKTLSAEESWTVLPEALLPESRLPRLTGTMGNFLRTHMRVVCSVLWVRALTARISVKEAACIMYYLLSKTESVAYGVSITEDDRDIVRNGPAYDINLCRYVVEDAAALCKHLAFPDDFHKAMDELDDSVFA
jgi:hypothetical protein